MADSVMDLNMMVELAKRKLAKLMPKEMEAATVREPNWFDKMFPLAPNVIAATDPFNRVVYKPEKLKGKSQDYINDILLHELTHVGQNLKRGGHFANFLSFPDDYSYAQNPNELEAFQAVSDNAMNEHRLPEIIAPSFYGGEKRYTDIELPKEKKRK